MKRIAVILMLLSAPLWAETVTGVALNNPIVVGGGSTRAEVILDAPATSDNVWVELQASGPVHVPMAVRVPAGQRSAAFTVLTDPTDNDVQVKIHASVRGDGPTVSLFQVLSEQAAKQ